MKVSQFVPPPLRQPLGNAKDYLVSFVYRGDKRYCPVCRKPSGRFGRYGDIPRDDARCMHCGALERHRLTWLFFGEKTNLFSAPPQRMLHIAPEPVFTKLLTKHLGSAYVSADLLDPRAMRTMDITDIGEPDDSFDVIYCGHVLEHVADDRRAMREFFRVLKPNGWAVLTVPITAEKTFEDPSVTDPAERLRIFGQEDHVRRCGPDYVDRLRESGFDVTVTGPSDFLDRDEIVRMGITGAAGEIYYCTKR
jgi:SAM-dependent methyltransferase